jgi:hydroxymethylbilane synthase
MWQARHVAHLLAQTGTATELVPLASRGDVDMRPIDGTRQVGLFTKRIQRAVLDAEADVAVHSLKDLPTESDPQLILAAIPPRETVIDCLVSPEAWTLDALPDSARVGTGSRRRAAQLKSLRPDLQILPIRGNVQTRLRKLDEGRFDAIVLAEAGLVRLEMNELPRHRLPLSQMLPAPGQGALGVEVRRDDAVAGECLGRLDHAPTRAAVTAERTLLAALHGGCLAPIAAYGQVTDDRLTLTAVVATPDGRERRTAEASERYDVTDPLATGTRLGNQVAEQLIDLGAGALIDQSR